MKMPRSPNRGLSHSLGTPMKHRFAYPGMKELTSAVTGCRKMSSLNRPPTVDEWLVKQAPAHSKAQARLMAMKSKEEGHPEKIQEWMAGYKSLPEKKAAEEQEAKNDLSYSELVKMVAEAYNIDASSPTFVDQLPALMREVDNVIQKRDRLEDAEKEIKTHIC